MSTMTAEQARVYAATTGVAINSIWRLVSTCHVPEPGSRWIVKDLWQPPNGTVRLRHVGVDAEVIPNIYGDWLVTSEFLHQHFVLVKEANDEPASSQDLGEALRLGEEAFGS